MQSRLNPRNHRPMFKTIYIEISNICNLQCSFCPEVERAKQVLSVTDFQTILRKVAPYTENICLHLMGEPLGHPNFADVMQACAAEGVPVKLTTNGVLLTGAKKDLLLLPNVSQVNFSVQSFADNFPQQNPQPYMKRLFKFARRAQAERPDMYINYRLWDLDPAQVARSENVQIREAIEGEYGVRFSDWTVDVRRKKGFVLADRTYVNFDSRFEWPSLNAPISSTRGRCHGLSSHIGVHADGTVVPCCLDKEAKLALGNIKHQTLEDILKSPRARAMREGFAAGNLVEDLCQRCTFIRRFDRKQGNRPSPTAR